MTPALHRALAALLGLRDGEALPLPVAIEATTEPQAALRRAWAACREPWALRDALAALGDAGAALLGLPPYIAARIRGWAPCPVPATTEGGGR